MLLFGTAKKETKAVCSDMGLKYLLRHVFSIILFIEYRFNIFKFKSPVIQMFSMPVSTVKPIEWSMSESARETRSGIYKMFLTIFFISYRY